MDRTDRVAALLFDIVAASFDQPRAVARHIDQTVSRNRSISSAERRETLLLAHQSMRWRRRLWGDIAPSRIDLGKVRLQLSEAEKLAQNPPFERWARLPVADLAREVSFPSWMMERWIEDQGLEPAVMLALSLNQPAPTTLRANTLKTDREALAASLFGEGVETVPCAYSPWGLALQTRYNLFSLHAFRQGAFEIQDEGSQLAVLQSDAKPGEFVIDACARTGGKSLALAALMENRGRVLACDIDTRVFEELEKRKTRAGASIIDHQRVAKDDPNPLPKCKGAADLVFVDAPCSGLGVLRRKSWMKWAIDAETPKAMHKGQVEILKRYAQYVRPGGKLVYVVCTINALENERVVRAFLDRNDAFESVESTRCFRPDVDGTDGFFIATFRRRS